MFKYLKIKNHKGVSEIRLENLGHINIICGKNNSGKTSILEALDTPNKYAIGRKVESKEKEWLEELFAPEAERYSNPYPEYSRRWFSEYLSDIVKKQSIWYNDEYGLIFKDIEESMKKNYHIGNRSAKIFNFDNLLNTFLGISKYKTILIPPKRNLIYEDKINLSENSLPSGEKIANRLFYLKNQIPSSEGYKTYAQISSAFKEISEYSFNIFPDQNNVIKIYFKKNDGEWLYGMDCGLGLSDILMRIPKNLI